MKVPPLENPKFLVSENQACQTDNQSSLKIRNSERKKKHFYSGHWFLISPITTNDYKREQINTYKFKKFCSLPFYTPVHHVESVEDYTLCMRQCPQCSSNMSYAERTCLHARKSHLRHRQASSYSQLQATAYHSHAQVANFTDMTMWSGVRVRNIPSLQMYFIWFVNFGWLPISWK